MRMKKWMKSTVALIALVSMLTENTYTVFAEVPAGNYADEMTVDEAVLAEDSMEVLADSSEEIVLESDEISDVVDGTEVDSEEEIKEVNINIGEAEDVLELSKADASIDAYEDKIVVNAANDITLYVNTDQMNSKDSFELVFDGNNSVVVDEALVGTLSKKASGIYHITGLEGQTLNVEAKKLSAGMTVAYKVRTDGNPQITLCSKDLPKVASKLNVTASGTEVKGAGYDDLTVRLDNSSLNKNVYYSLHVVTDADASCNGKVIQNGVVPSISGSTSVLRLSDLDNKEFTLYIEGENVDTVATEYVVESVANGAIRASLSMSDKAVEIDHEDEKTVDAEDEDKEDELTVSDNEVEETKRVYDFEDDDVYVTVTLDNPADLPDEAVLHADPVNAENNPELLAEVASKILEKAENDTIMPINFYVYDVYFTVDDEEVEPASAVNVKITYKTKNETEYDELPVDDIKTFHFVENENGDIKNVEEVTDNVVTDASGDVESVEARVDSFSLFATAVYTKENTFLGDGGSYSIGYILNNYNIFVKNKIIDTNHTVGPIACGGDAEITYWGITGTDFDACSYIKGNLTQGGWYASVGGQALYLGNVNKDKFYWKDSCWMNVNGRGINSCKGVFCSDKYMDFDAAFSSIKSEIAALKVDCNIDLSKSSSNYSLKNGTLNIKSGMKFSIDSLDGISTINITGGDIQSAVDTILVINSSAAISSFPDVKVNGSQQTSAEYGKNSSILFILPNTKSITMRMSHAHFGHIIAPNAKVSFPGGGDYNGCVICNEFYSESHEGHMWPYNGKVFNGVSTGFVAVKTVDGAVPTAAQEFTFTLEKWNGSKWNVIQTKKNSGDKIVFDQIAYSENDEGTHYYRIKESENIAGYVKNTTSYIVKVVVKNIKTGYAINQTKEETYYLGDSINATQNVTSMTFDNKKESGSITLLKNLAVADSSKKTFYVTLQNAEGKYYNETNKSFGSSYSEIVVNVGSKKTVSGLDFGTYTVTEVKSKAIDSNGNEYEVVYNVNGNTKTCTVGSSNQSVNVTVDGNENVEITNKQLGQLSVTKSYLDASGKTINDGTVFYVTLSSTNGTASSSTTYYDTKGKEYTSKKVLPIKAGETIKFAPLPLLRTYTLKETDSKGNAISDAADYDVVNGTTTFYLKDTSASDLNRNVVITNKKHNTGKIAVMKKDATTLTAIDGAYFHLKNDDTNALIYTTGSEGAYTYSASATKTYTLGTKDGTFYVDGLPYGNYRLEEIVFPYGYKKVDTVMHFTVCTDGMVNRSVSSTSLIAPAMTKGSFNGAYTVKNTPVPFKVRIVKKYSPLLGGSEKPLKGVKFTLKKEGTSNVLSAVTDSDGIAEFENLSWGTYTYSEEVPSGYVAGTNSEGKFTVDNTVEPGIIDFSGNPVYVVNVTNKPVSGGVKLVKTDKDTSKPMANVCFNLYDANGSAVYSVLRNGVYTYTQSSSQGATAEYVTNASGEITVNGLPYAVGYYFKEKTPTGYVVNDAKYSFNVTNNGGVANVTVKNEKIKGYVELLKKDKETGSALAGAEFALYKADGTPVGTYKTDASGKIAAAAIGALEYGKYYFTEKSAPAGYSFDASKKYEFSITKSTDVAVEVAVDNERVPGKVSFIKLDANTGKVLDGAKFSIFSADNLTKALATATTANGGKITFDNLSWGKYIIKEVGAPTGYAVNTKEFSFEINGSNLDVDLSKAYTIDNEEVPGAIRLIKNDGEGHTLEGAKFELYKDGSRYPDNSTVYTCDANGEITVTNLPWGTYYFVEVYAPEGFVLPQGDAAKSLSVTIGASNTVNALTSDEKNKGEKVHVNVISIANEKIYGSLLLHKVDSKGAKLTGATFKLYLVDNAGAETLVKVSGSAGNYEYAVAGSVDVLATDNAGDLYVKGLPYGKYSLHEETAPSGYKRDTNPRYFNIDKQGAVAEYDFENTLVKANVEFIKVDNDDKALEGASFTLYKSVNGEYKAQTTVTSGKDGHVLVEGLGIGTYYFAEENLEGYEVNSEKYGFTITEAENGKTITLPSLTKKIDNLAAVVNVRKLGSAKIKKVEEGKNIGLPGAQFALYNADTNKVVAGYETIATGDDGYAVADNLEWGNYYFVEVKAPENYALDSETKYEFSVNAENVSAVINVGNAEDKLVYGGAKLNKKDVEDKSALAGAVFALYSSDGKVVAGYESIMSDTDGLIKTDLDILAGTYFFKEISAPTGYKLDSETKYFFTINQANMGTLVEANAEGKTDNTAWNTRLPGKVELFKYIKDGSVKIGLSDAEFELYVGTKILNIFNSDKLVGTYKTNNDGIIAVDNLAWGDYYFLEKNPPVGYEKDDTKIEFTIGKDSLDYTGSARLEFANGASKGAIKLIKTDETDGSKLAGAAFKLWQVVDGVTVAINNKEANDGLFVTDKNGEIVVKDLEWGTYYFEEMAAPSSYELPKNCITSSVTIDRNNVKESVNAPLTINATNKKVYGSVELIKTNEDGSVVLEGAEFELYSDASYKNKVYAVDNGNGSYTYSASKSGATDTFVTNNSGKLAVDNIPVGTYYFKEIAAPEGYLVETENAGMFTIDEKNTPDNRANVNIKVVCVKDKRITGYVELIKVDKDDEDTTLNGVIFDLYKVEGNDSSSKNVKKINRFETTNGMISKEVVGPLEFGNYYFVEIETVDGYKLNSAPYEFAVSEQDKVITITADNERELGEVTLEKFNSDRSKNLNGATYELYSTNPSGVVQKLASVFGSDYHKYGEYVTANGGIIKVDNLPWGNYYFVEKSAPTGYITDSETKYYFTIDDKNLKVELTGAKGATDKEEPGAIKLIKNDGEGNTLEGAIFELYKDGERYPNAEKTYVTDSNGEIVVNNLPYGTYYFAEDYAPEKFVLPEGDAAKSSTVVINETNTISSVEVNIITCANEKIYGSLKLRKVDDNGKELTGATFYLVQVVNGSENNVKVSGSNGVYTFDKTAGFLSTKQILTMNGSALEVKDLPYGTYRVYEEDAPVGYNKIESPFEFKIDTQGKEVSFDFVNSLVQANVEFVKTDVDGKALADAIFHLYKKGTEDIDLGTVTSDTKGVVYKTGLGVGDYYFVEDSAPKGYSGNEKQYTFSITAEDNGKTVSIDNADRNIDGKAAVVNTPKLGSVKLWKIEKGTNNGLSGAKFDLYKKGQDAPVKMGLVSDEQGYVTVHSLEWGGYYFKETKAPEGYVLDSDKEYAFKIDAENVDNVVTVDIKGNELIVENELVYGQAKLTKKNSVSDEVIEGAVFALYNAADDSIVDGYDYLVTDKNGEIVTNNNLLYGKYYFKEIKPAIGYEINDTKYDFTIDQSVIGKIVPAGKNGIALNVPKKGKVELFKYVEDANLVQTGLAGAEFTLYVKDSVLGFIKYDKEFETYVTNKEGVIAVSDLPWGEYYFQETNAPAGYEKDNQKIEFVINATQLDYTGSYRLKLANKPYTGSVKLIKYYAINGEQKGTLEGAAFKFYRLDGSESVEIKNNTADGLYVTDKNGEINITDLEWGSYYFEEQSAPEGYALPDKTKTEIVTIGSDNVEESIKNPLTVSLTNDKVYGNVELLKIDDATPANRLEGATFELHKDNGDYVFVEGKDGVYTYSEEATDVVMVSPEGGRILVKQLPFGKYYFVEKSAPSGYLTNEEHISFAIDTNQAPDDEPLVSKTCINSKVRAAVSFMKADTTIDNPLAGAVFTLYKVGAAEDGSNLEISDVESNESGLVTYSNLGIGNYYFVEKSTPNDAYKLNTNKYTFAITTADNGKTVALDNAENNVVINYPRYGEVELIKYYNVNGSKAGTLAGAVFSLYMVGADGKDVFVKDCTTKNDGTLNVNNLEWGSYYFVEKSAPSGYEFDANKKYSFEINQENVTEVQIAEAYNDRLPGYVELEKLDSIDNTPLSGVVFELYKDYGTDSESLIATLTTENGKASQGGLLFGDYTLVEKSTIEGYVLNDDKYTFTIDGDNLSKAFNGIEAIKNDRIQGYVELLKKDANTKVPMSDVMFELYKGTESNSVYVGSYVTDETGKLIGDNGDTKVGPLDFGEYYFKEITPVGYVANDAALAFKIETNGQLVSFTDSKTVYNTPEDGAVVLRKTDENGKPLAGAIFTLYAKTPKTMGQTLSTLFSDAYEVGMYTTNDNGEIRVSSLEWDSYYFVETKPPIGYEIIEPGKKYEFVIDSNSTKAAIELGTIKNRQQLGTLELVKLDAETNEAIEGAEFKLYKVDAAGDIDVSAKYGAEGGVFRTSAEGTLTIENVEWGSYYFLEIKAPYGYEAISDTNVVKSNILTINENNADSKTNIMQPQKTTVYNQMGYGYVSLLKKFDGNQPKSLAGVEFALVNDTKNENVGTFSTNEDGIITAEAIGRLTYGDYHFEEVSVPLDVSYSVSSFKLAFSITESNAIADAVQYEFVNSEIMASAKFVKVDTDSKNAIAGIKFNVFNKLNESVPATVVTSDAQGVVIVKSLPMGDYYFLEDEKSALDAGYIADKTRYEFSITPADRPEKDSNGNLVEKFVDVYKASTTDVITTVYNTKACGNIKLIKLGKNQNGNEALLDISGASFELYKDGVLYMTSEELSEYVNGSELLVPGLPWGLYYFKETAAPSGYALPQGAAAITNKVTLDETTVSASLETPLTCQITDDTIRVYISKRVIGGSEELPGATIELYEAGKDGKKIGEPLTVWTSGTSPKLIEIGGDVAEGLKAGKKYVIHEDTAPIGYGLTTDITFIVNEDGSVTTDARVSGSRNGMTIILEDAALNVSVSKKEMGSGTELAGATLRILHNEDVIETWISTGNSHVIATALEVGETYTLEEVNPPKGYYTAEPITFVVNADGTIQITKDASASAEVSAVTNVSGNAATLTMYDRPIRVEISKKRLSGGSEDYVQGAELALYEQKGNDFEQIYAWVSPVSGPVLIDYGLLKVGNKYKVVETKAPVGFVKASDIYFSVKDYSEFEKTDANGMVTQSVTMFDSVINAVISKQSITGGDELPGAKLQVIDENGKVVVEFISSDKKTLITPVESESKLSAEEKAFFADYNVIYGKKLEGGKTYTLREIQAPDGYAVAEDVIFKVNEDGNTVPSPVVMKDKPLEIVLSKKDISTDQFLAGASLEVYNEANEKVAEWVSSDKPVLLSVRDVDETELAEYAEVIPVKLPVGTYRMHEVSAPEGYSIADDITFVIDGSCVKTANGTIRSEVMYDYKEGTTVFKGTKFWIEPKDNAGNIKAEFEYPDITIELYRDSAIPGVMDKEPVRTVTLKNGQNNFAFGDLEKYRSSDGLNYEYTYQAVEVMSDAATKEFTSSTVDIVKDEDGTNTIFFQDFTNLLTQDITNLTVVKKFALKKDEKGNVLKDVKYDDVTIYLLQNGKRVDIDENGELDCVVIKNGALDTNGEATHVFEDLPKYDLTTGNEYAYSIEEAGAANYVCEIVTANKTSVIEGENGEKYSIEGTVCNVKNTPKIVPFRISGKKVWYDPDGIKRPDVTIQLFRDGKLYKETKLNADNTFSFDSLYEYNLGFSNDEGDYANTADGHKFVYTVKEVGATGYDITVEYANGSFSVENNVAEVTITNRIKQEYVEIGGTKIWNDAGDSAKRPNVTVELYATDTCGRTNELVDKYIIPNTSTKYEFGVAGRKRLPMYDDNGKVIEYYIDEVAMEGYLSVISGNDITNTPSKTRISKIDASTREELAGAELALIRTSTNEEVERWMSTNESHYVEALAIGEEYTLTEISAPVGYVLADPITFTVNADGVEQQVVMEDDPIIGEVELIKLDAENREKLAGAVFNLYSSDGKLLSATGTVGAYVFSKAGAGTTNLSVSDAGVLTVTELPYGSYYFKEVSAPSGYELNDETIEFSVVNNGDKIAATCLDTRKMGTVRFTKTDETETVALEGAVFELYCKTPRTAGQAAASTVFQDAYYRYGTYKTDSEGKISVENLPWDDYYFVEVEAPDGYVTNRDVTGEQLAYTFSIDNETVKSVAVDLSKITNSTGEVEGVRAPEVVSGVLGVRSTPTSGVLGTRVGPPTGDASAIALWIALLLACVATICFILSTRKRRLRNK